MSLITTIAGYLSPTKQSEILAEQPDSDPLAQTPKPTEKRPLEVTPPPVANKTLRSETTDTFDTIMGDAKNATGDTSILLL